MYYELHDCGFIYLSIRRVTGESTIAQSLDRELMKQQEGTIHDSDESNFLLYNSTEERGVIVTRASYSRERTTIHTQIEN